MNPHHCKGAIDSERHLAMSLTGICVLLPRGFDLHDDYFLPHSHRAEYSDSYGRTSGVYCRVEVDHGATATKTSGTGDTRVRILSTY
jgi:hypothetical protein